MKTAVALVAVTLVAAFSVGTPGAAAQGAAAAKACATPQHRQFDFWVGSWDVRSSQAKAGAPPAENEIRLAHGGCVLHESYANGAFTGSSFSYYDAAKETWRQTWVDNQGGSLRLSGGLVDGSMVLSQTGADGTTERITWTPRDDGTVRQLWERSQGGQGEETWSVVFDGVYSRRDQDEAGATGDTDGEASSGPG